MNWYSRAWAAIPAIKRDYPTHRWLHLTFTIPNVEVGELRAALEHLRDSFNRLTRHRRWPGRGWIRTLEATRNPKDGTAHPHLHVLALVPARYFTSLYVRHDQWQDMWRQAARLEGDPHVYVQRVRAKARHKHAHPDQDAAERAAFCELLKYPVKMGDLLEDPEWFLELTRQTAGVRLVSTGGVIRKGKYLSPRRASDRELVEGDESTPPPDQGGLFLSWWRANPDVARYGRLVERQRAAN